MKISESEISQLVRNIVEKIKSEGLDASIPQIDAGIGLGDGVFRTVDEAINASEAAYEQLSRMGLKARQTIIAAMRTTALSHAKELAELAVEETGLGRIEDKVIKNELAARKTPGVEDLMPRTDAGDEGMTLLEYAPFGIIGSITPTTNPAATIINNSLSMVAAGNSVVFNPHPSAKRVSIKAMQLLNRAIISAGGPEHVLSCVAEPTLATSGELMNHKKIRVLVVTGGGAVVKAAMSTGKKVIAAGPGNPPVVVDDTADLVQAGRDIVLGASFDNNVLCTAEKEVFVVDKVMDALKAEMIRNGAYELKEHELRKLLDVVLISKDGRYYPNKDFVGKDASLLLKQIGIRAEASIKLVMAEAAGDHPLVFTEMLMPIVPLVRVKSVDEAIDMAVVAEKGNRHTAIMHSQNIKNLSRMERKIKATIFVKNGPSYAGLGQGGEGHTTLTIAGPTGEGLTSARTFTRRLRSVFVDG